MTPSPDPIAVIGIACRLPGAADPEALWALLRDGLDAVTEPPADRPLPLDPGRRAGFVADVDRFDPGFFGVSPREAAGMDPRHRLMLELSWEALEDAGIGPAPLGRHAVGVYAGAMADDHAPAARDHGAPPLPPYPPPGRHRRTI